VRCNKVKNILGAYLDGELSEQKAKRVHKHLAKCSACAWELKSFQKINELGRWMAKTESTQLSEGYWEDYQASLHARLEQEEMSQKSVGFLNRRWYLPLAYAAHWLKKMAPGLAVAVVIAALIVGVNYVHRQSPRISAQGSPGTEKIAVNFYLKEHESAVRLASYSAQPSERGIELGYEDVFYYDAARGPNREWPGETGVFLRGPRRSSYPVRREPSRAADIANGHRLSLREAEEAVSFRIAAPQILHPAYFLENIRKVEGSECLQLVYTNGISTLSLFEQAVESAGRLRSGDFREYVMYSKSSGGSDNIIGWNSAEISFTLIGEEKLSHLMAIIRAIQKNYLRDEAVDQYERKASDETS